MASNGEVNETPDSTKIRKIKGRKNIYKETGERIFNIASTTEAQETRHSRKGKGNIWEGKDTYKETGERTLNITLTTKTKAAHAPCKGRTKNIS